MLTMNPAVTISETKDTIEILAPPESDFFIDPDSGKAKSDAPFYYERIAGDFVARVLVKTNFKKKYDAGGLFVADEVQVGYGRSGEHLWGFAALAYLVTLAAASKRESAR